MLKPKDNREQLKQLAAKLTKHPQYQENPQVRAIIDEYRHYLLDASIGEAELSNVLKAIRGSLADYVEKGEDPIESVFRGLRLREQFESQFTVACKSGLFLLSGINGTWMNDGRPAIVRFNQIFPMLKWDEVRSLLLKNKEIIKEKSGQGFTKMLIVPFGYNLKTMAERFKERVMEMDSSGGIFDWEGDEIVFNRDDENYPVGISDSWDDRRLVYYPKSYDRENHGGICKEDVIKINGAWQICFVEESSVIPDRGQFLIYGDGMNVGDRMPIDRKGGCMKGQTITPSIRQYKEAMDQKEKMENPKMYQHERGMTPEIYLWLQFCALLQKDKPVLLDHVCASLWGGTYLIDCYLPGSDLENGVPIAHWGLPTLLHLGVLGPGGSFPQYGIRPVVNLSAKENAALDKIGEP